MVTAEVTFSKNDLLGLKNPMTLIGVDWETYEEISEELGESTSLHLTFNNGTLTIMPVTEIHEMLIVLLERFIGLVSLATQKNIIPTGKATLRSKRRNYGSCSQFCKLPPGVWQQFCPQPEYCRFAVLPGAGGQGHYQSVNLSLMGTNKSFWVCVC